MVLNKALLLSNATSILKVALGQYLTSSDVYWGWANERAKPIANANPFGGFYDTTPALEISAIYSQSNGYNTVIAYNAPTEGIRVELPTGVYGCLQFYGSAGVPGSDGVHFATAVGNNNMLTKSDIGKDYPVKVTPFNLYRDGVTGVYQTSGANGSNPAIDWVADADYVVTGSTTAYYGRTNKWEILPGTFTINGKDCQGLFGYHGRWVIEDSVAAAAAAWKRFAFVAKGDVVHWNAPIGGKSFIRLHLIPITPA